MAKAKGKTANIFVWIILGLLIIGLAGFGVEGFGGRVNTVGKVGDRDITTQEYFRALQQEIRAIEQQSGQALGFQRAQAMGLDRQVLRNLVTTAALENEAMRLGISVSDSTVRDEVLSIPGFQGLDGSFSREAYRFALQQEGWSEREFEDRIRMELARDILQTGAIAAAPAPRVMTDTLIDWLGERRSFTALRVDRSALDAPVPAPDDATLRAFYEAEIDRFTLPEARRIAYAWVTPAMLVDSIEIEEEALREAYRLRASEFTRPERRLVERLVFPTEDAAREARARIDAGEADFEDIVAERGLSMSDTDMGDVTEEELGAAGAEVFALDGPGLTGPLPSPFGPALFNVAAILSAQETPFEEAVPELRETLAADRARRLIADAFDDYEDILAGGATLEQLAEETPLEFGTIEFRNDSREGIAAYEAFRRAAATVSDGDFPEMTALEDGGVFALRLDGTVPPRPEPFDDVVIQVIDAWDSSEAAARVEERAAEIRSALDGGADPADFGLTPESHEEVLRSDSLSGVPRSVVEAVFALELRARSTVMDGETAWIVTLDAVMPPETGTDTATARRDAVARELRNSVAQDIFTAWARQLEREAGISLDDRAIEAVHQNFR